MSTLLEQASLVMIPSGYKEDIVYSQIPTNGNGDLTFTRASNGTRINSAGLVEVVPWNLVSYSNTFSDSSWVKSSCTLTSGQNDPNGGTNGWRYLSSVAATGYAYQNGVLQNGVQYTFYIYAKSNTGSNQTMYFTANSGSFTSPAFTLTSSWQLCSWTFTANSTGNNILFGYNPSATLDLLVYGAQLNIGSTAKPYFPTTDRLNVPRLTYQNEGGGCPSLLLEKQSTNLVSYSEQFDNAAWNKYLGTVTADTAISPDGTQNADLIYPSSTGSLAGQLFRQISSGISSGDVVTVSAFVKASGKNFAYLSQIQNSFSPDAYFNLTTGAITNISSGVTASMTQLTNGWWRISITSTAGAGSYYAVIGSTDSAGNITNTASGTNGILVYGYQVEVSSYLTSYIPTTSSSATRVADACYKTGISSLIGQTEGTMFADFTMNISGDSYQSILIGNGTQRVYFFYIKASNIFGWSVYIGGSGFGDTYTTFSPTNGQRYKMALAYKSGSNALYINGALVASSSATIGTATLSDFYFSYLSSELFNMPVNQAALFPTRLTNAELASLTTI